MSARAPTVVLESHGTARIVRIVRPEKRNALDAATLRALVRAARAIARDRGARAIVLTGVAGVAFAAGGDLRALARVRSASGARAVSRMGRDAIDALRDAGVPLVAAVSGDAHGGGCELAAACDYRVVESHARFHWVHGRMGVTTGWGGTAALVSLVGPGAAARWLLTGATVSADEALRARFADEVVAAGAAVDAACALAASLAGATRATTRRQLELVRAARDVGREAARDAELRAFARGWVTRAHRDAIERFLARSRA